MAKDKKTAIAEHKAARRALDAIAERDKRTGNREETPEYLAANRRVIETEKNVPWYRR